jgi:hypothetical protein
MRLSAFSRSRVILALIVGATVLTCGVIALTKLREAVILKKKDINLAKTQVLDSFGRPLPSLFYGLRPTPMKLDINGRENCSQSLASRVANLFELRVVSASNCTAGTCSGSYYTFEWRDCPPACFGILRWFYVDSTKAGPHDGWKYSGVEKCIWGCAVCEEVACVN